jgi:hypothetical protein
MENRPVGPRRVVAHAFVEWFADLGRGDPVAWAVCFGLLLFFAVIAVLGAWFIWRRKRVRDAFQKRVAEKRKKEDKEFKASRKTKEI